MQNVPDCCAKPERKGLEHKPGRGSLGDNTAPQREAGLTKHAQYGKSWMTAAHQPLQSNTQLFPLGREHFSLAGFQYQGMLMRSMPVFSQLCYFKVSIDRYSGFSPWLNTTAKYLTRRRLKV